MRVVDAIPVAPVPDPTPIRGGGDLLRAVAGPRREVIDDSIVRTVDQVELTAREASRPLDFWAKLALDNVRHPPTYPRPYWAELHLAKRQLERAESLHSRPIEHDVGQRERAKRCACDEQDQASYAGPSLSDLAQDEEGPDRPAQTNNVTSVQHYAASGRLVDMLV